MDTTGKVYRSFEVFAKVYQQAQISKMPLYFMKNTALINAAGDAASMAGLSHLVLELLPLVLKGESSTRSAAARR